MPIRSIAPWICLFGAPWLPSPAIAQDAPREPGQEQPPLSALPRAKKAKVPKAEIVRKVDPDEHAPSTCRVVIEGRGFSVGDEVRVARKNRAGSLPTGVVTKRASGARFEVEVGEGVAEPSDCDTLVGAKLTKTEPSVWQIRTRKAWSPALAAAFFGEAGTGERAGADLLSGAAKRRSMERRMGLSVDLFPLELQESPPPILSGLGLGASFRMAEANRVEHEDGSRGEIRDSDVEVHALFRVPLFQSLLSFTFKVTPWAQEASRYSQKEDGAYERTLTRSYSVRTMRFGVSPEVRVSAWLALTARGELSLAGGGRISSTTKDEAFRLETAQGKRGKARASIVPYAAIANGSTLSKVSTSSWGGGVRAGYWGAIGTVEGARERTDAQYDLVENSTKARLSRETTLVRVSLALTL